MFIRMLLILFLTLVLTIVAFFLQRLYKYKVIDEYPGPSTWELIKFMIISKSTADSYKYLLNLNEKYGPVVKIWLKPFRPTLLVADQKCMKHILLSKEHVHKPATFALLIPLVGDGLSVMQDVNLWRQERKMLARVFNSQVVTEYTSTFKNHVVNLSNTVKNNLNVQTDVQQLLLRHGLNIVYEVFLTEDISNQNIRVDKFMRALKAFFEVYFERTNSLYQLNDALFKLTKGFDVWSRSCKDAKEFVESTFKKVWEVKRTSKEKSEKQDLLDLLLETGLSYDRLLEHLRTFVIGGSDTISTCVAFALYELSKNPEMQETIFQEYIAILGESKDVSAEYNDIQKMTYTECVVKESLRMYPPVPLLFRTLATPAKIDGRLFPDGVDVIFSVQRSHQINFENSSKFEPERFLPENSHKIPVHGYAPFSFGPRDCIGKVIGITEAKFLLSYIVRHFKIHPVVDHELNLVGELILTSKTGVHVIFDERQ